jgi:hypothetical protein
MSVTTILFILAFAGMIAMHLRGHGGHGGGHGQGGHDQGHGSHGGCGGGHGSHGSEPADHSSTEVGDRDSTDHHATHR